MANANQAQEPSMEEILASIRRIISDEEPAAATPEAEAAGAGSEPEMGGGDAMSQDDLDKLFDSADDAEIEPEPEPEPEPVASSDDDAEDVFELTEDLAVEDDEMDMAAAMAMDEMQAGDVAFVEPESEPEPEVAPDPEPAPQVGSARAAIGDDGLLSADANQAVHSAFTNLAGTILSNNSRTLEDLVKELLRPMLKEWLDDNLPSMVERMVRQEIERISRGR
jgi:hypothetical protein